MSKTSTELIRHALNGPTMGTRWSALFFAVPGFDTGPVQAALQQATDEVDAQMSTWNPDSDLMRLNRAPVNTPVVVPDELAQVLALGVAIGRASGGAFDIGMGDAVQAWGFGPEAVNEEGIRRALSAPRRPAHETLELAGSRVRKREAITLDLNGIAKGYGVDRLAQTLRSFGITAGLVGIDAGPAARWRGMDDCGRGARSRLPRSEFDPAPARWRCRHLGRLPAWRDGAGPPLVAHNGPAAGRAAAVFASVGHRACPDLCRSRRLGHSLHGDRLRSRVGTRGAAGTERVVPDTGWQGWATVKRMRIVPG